MVVVQGKRACGPTVARPALGATDDLIATIYEAALLPGRWSQLPELIARRLGAADGVLCRRDGLGERAGENGPNRDADTQTSVAVGAPGRGEWILRLDRFADSDQAADARRVLLQLVPHLARATAIHQQQLLHESRLTVAAIDRIGSGAAVMDDAGRVLAANARFALQLGALASVEMDLPVRLTARRDGNSLRAMLAEAIVSGRRCTVPIHDQAGFCIAALHLLPITDGARQHGGATVLALVARPNSEMLPGLVLLQSLFGLTQAEARLARGIAAGHTLETVARASGITLETARSHIKRVFSKTCTTRQLELTLLIRGFGIAKASEEEMVA